MVEWIISENQNRIPNTPPKQILTYMLRVVRRINFWNFFKVRFTHLMATLCSGLQVSRPLDPTIAQPVDAEDKHLDEYRSGWVLLFCLSQLTSRIKKSTHTISIHLAKIHIKVCLAPIKIIHQEYDALSLRQPFEGTPKSPYSHLPVWYARREER